MHVPRVYRVAAGELHAFVRDHGFGTAGHCLDGAAGAPDVVDALVKMPLLMTEGLRVLEKTARRRPENPLAGMRATLLAGQGSRSTLAKKRLWKLPATPSFLIRTMLLSNRGSKRDSARRDPQLPAG